MIQLWAVDPWDRENVPDNIREAIMEHGRYLELSNDSHFFVDPKWTDPEDMTEAEKTLLKYIEDHKLDPETVIFFYNW